MQKPRISIIVALGEKTRAIGRSGGGLLWHITEDLKRFRRLTEGHPIIMGRKTFESIGRVLPKRTNIIISRNPALAIEGAIVAHSLDEALTRARELENEEIFVIGGGEIYRQTLPLADRLYLTLVHDDTPGDVFFPPYEEFSKVVEGEKMVSNNLFYTWVTLERK